MNLAWKWSGALLKRKDKGEVIKKGKYKQEKKKQLTKSKKKMIR